MNFFDLTEIFKNINVTFRQPSLDRFVATNV